MYININQKFVRFILKGETKLKDATTDTQIMQDILISQIKNIDDVADLQFLITFIDTYTMANQPYHQEDAV